MIQAGMDDLLISSFRNNTLRATFTEQRYNVSDFIEEVQNIDWEAIKIKYKSALRDASLPQVHISVVGVVIYQQHTSIAIDTAREGEFYHVFICEAIQPRYNHHLHHNTAACRKYARGNE